MVAILVDFQPAVRRTSEEAKIPWTLSMSASSSIERAGRPRKFRDEWHGGFVPILYHQGAFEAFDGLSDFVEPISREKILSRSWFEPMPGIKRSAHSHPYCTSEGRFCYSVWIESRG